MSISRVTNISALFNSGELVKIADTVFPPHAHFALWPSKLHSQIRVHCTRKFVQPVSRHHWPYCSVCRKGYYESWSSCGKSAHDDAKFSARIKQKIRSIIIFNIIIASDNINSYYSFIAHIWLFVFTTEIIRKGKKSRLIENELISCERELLFIIIINNIYL